MRIDGMSLHMDDVVFYGERAGLIVTCAQEGVRFYAIVNELVLNRTTTNRCCNCTLHKKQLVWPAHELEQERVFFLQGRFVDPFVRASCLGRMLP